MRKFNQLFVMALFSAVVSNAANAASVSVSFDLQGAGPDVNELNLSESGLDLNISPDTISNGGSLNNESDIRLTRTANGLGVDNRNCAFFVCDSDQLDGLGYNDIALFSFSKEVTIESFTLANVDGNDDLRLFGGPGFTQLGSFSIPFPGSVVTFPGLPTNLLTGNLFGIAAFDWNDNFRIAGLTVSYDAVPIPAALPLMLTGLAGLGVFARRQKRLAAQAG